MSNLQKITDTLLRLPPDESLREARALVDRYTKEDVHWRIGGLPDAIAEIQEVMQRLWIIQDRNGRYKSILSALEGMPPDRSPSLPPGF